MNMVELFSTFVHLHTSVITTLKLPDRGARGFGIPGRFSDGVPVLCLAMDALCASTDQSYHYSDRFMI